MFPPEVPPCGPTQNRAEQAGDGLATAPTIHTAEQPPAKPALCVAIHDVAPTTWPACLRLLRAIRDVAEIPLTWLVVPRYHGSKARSRACETMLAQLMAEGHEVALHGYTHLDTAPLGLELRSRLLRTVYTRREGEFAAIGPADAHRRIELGLALFRERHWAPAGQVAGFVAPAWLLGEQAWEVLGHYCFSYTTTWSHFHLLPERYALLSPALVYTARNRTGRLVSPRIASAAATLMHGAPLLRLALHPRDAHYPSLIRHAQGLVERLLRTREPLTKAQFAKQLAREVAGRATAAADAAASAEAGRATAAADAAASAQDGGAAASAQEGGAATSATPAGATSTVPMLLPSPSVPAQSQGSSAHCHNVGHLPWR